LKVEWRGGRERSDGVAAKFHSLRPCFATVIRESRKSSRKRWRKRKRESKRISTKAGQ
jgi:hypothetical protein